MTGGLLVDKPAGPTSHDVVARARRALGVSRIGHTGTLDPLATGLLVLLVGRATRLAQFMASDVKEYVADIRLGIETATYDAEGLDAGRAEDQKNPGAALPETGAISAALEAFRGTFLQVPPPFSAKKVAGRRAYAHARGQTPIALPPVEVTTHQLEIMQSSGARLRLRLVCSAGFYVRSLAHDLGRALGCGAHLQALRRTGAGGFSVDEAISLMELEERRAEASARLLSPSQLLKDMPALRLSEEGVRRVEHGNVVSPRHLLDAVPVQPGMARVQLLDGSSELIAVAETSADGSLHPVVVLV